MSVRNEKGIYMAVLNQGKVRVELSYLMTELTHQGKYFLNIDYPSEKPISNNRNKIVRDFLEDDRCEYLLMIDNDIIPPLNILDLADFDKDIMAPVMFAYRGGGIIPLLLDDNEIEREDGTMKETFKIKEGMTGHEGLMQVDAIGTGCIFVKKEVLKAMEDDDVGWFMNEYDEKGEKERGLDLAFCKRAREKGFEIWTHTNFVCSHWITMDLAQIYASLSEEGTMKGVPLGKTKKPTKILTNEKKQELDL